MTGAGPAGPKRRVPKRRVPGRRVAGLRVAGLRGPVLVTGTDTGVGKTVVTAAVAAAAGAAGLRVAVVKPAQTGADSDVDEVVRLAAPAGAVALTSYPDPLAPLVAAETAGAVPLGLALTRDRIVDLAATNDLVLVEGAGGLLVPMGRTAAGAEWTVADLAATLGAPAVVVARAGLGTLNHTALTLEALRRRGIAAHLVLGAWPAAPRPVHRTNLDRLRPMLAGILPEAAAALPPARFRTAAGGWLAPVLHGTAPPTGWAMAHSGPGGR